METFKELTTTEKKMLLKYPAYISLLAANADGGLDEAEKTEAIKFAHIKTYSSVPELSDFYKEAERVFEANINELNEQLPKDKKERAAAIQGELATLKPVLIKVGKKYASLLKISMKSYQEHVSKAHNNVLESFLFPIHIDGLTD